MDAADKEPTNTPPRRLEALLLLLPMVVALVQITLVSTSDLTRWRGGGFGMYSDTHPMTSRRLWLEGQAASGSPAALRIYPVDQRLREVEHRSSRLRRDVDDLRYFARVHRNFPSLRSKNDLEATFHRFLENHGDHEVVQDVVPRTDVKLKVVEVALASDLSTLEPTIISEFDLCVH